MSAGEAAGGDKRGKQSAALAIWTTEEYPAVSLRVDDHADPLRELARLESIGRERLFHYVKFMPSRANPHGTLDRDVIEAGIAAAVAATERQRNLPIANLGGDIVKARTHLFGVLSAAVMLAAAWPPRRPRKATCASAWPKTPTISIRPPPGHMWGASCWRRCATSSSTSTRSSISCRSSRCRMRPRRTERPSRSSCGRA